MAETKKLTLIQKLQKIQTEMKAPKNLLNKFGGYKYRNAEGILEALKPYEEKYGVATTLTDTIEEVGGRVYVVAIATIYDCDSDATLSVSARARESEVKKGMDDSQLTGATSSYARKYALNGLFLLDDTKDADTDEYRNETEAKSKATPKTAPAPATPKKEISEASKKIRRELVEYCKANDVDVSRYGLNNDSSDEAFKEALENAKYIVAERQGDLPFPLN